METCCVVVAVAVVGSDSDSVGSTETVDGNGRFVFERRWGGFVLY